MVFKDINVDTPTNDEFGKEFLCIIKECDVFQRYELCEWFNPLSEGMEALDESEKPHFSVDYKSCGQQALSREVTHWAVLPYLSYRL